MRNNDALMAGVEAGSTPNYMKSKSDIVEYYRDTYGEKEWRKHYTSDTIKAEGLPNTAKVRNTISRRVQGDRADREVGKGKTGQQTRESFEKVGQQLPPVSRSPKSETITVTITGHQNEAGGKRDREFTVTLSGTAAYDFVNNPDYDALYDEIFYGEYDGEFDYDSSELMVTGVSIS